MKLNQYIDHTALKPEETEQNIIKLCNEAKMYRFASVCVNPVWVKLCAEQLSETGVKVATVIGFPLGATTPEVKAFETSQAIDHGATEVDMVLNVGWLKSKRLDLVAKDIHDVVKTAGQRAIVKVILETGLLTDEEIEEACKLSVQAGAQFVKTSTGFGAGGATLHHIRLMRKTVGPDVGVKASGGIRDFETAVAMVEAGATRIGTSAGVKIVEGHTTGEEGY